MIAFARFVSLFCLCVNLFAVVVVLFCLFCFVLSSVFVCVFI